MDDGLPMQQGPEDFDRFVQTEPTERAVLVALAWTGLVADEETAASVDRRLIVVTSRLNLLIMGFRAGAAGIEEDGGPPPTKDYLEVISFRDLGI